jgi:dipeptidyl aminopeptidase/acylaminoacyl peptidase
MLAAEIKDTGGRRNATLRYWQRFMGASSPGDPALDSISPLRLADKARIPVLLVHGKDDTVVPYEQSSSMEAALRKAGASVELITMPGEDHWLSRPVTRTQMLTATMAFLEKHNPIAAAPAAAAP